MGKSRQKDPKVRDAVITEDGCLIVEMNVKLYPHTSKVIFTPEALLSLAEEYGEIPPAGQTEFPGIPLVEEEAIFDDDKEENPRKKGKKEEE